MFEKELGHQHIAKKNTAVINCITSLFLVTVIWTAMLQRGIMISSKWVTRQAPFKVPLKSDVELSDISHDLHQQFISILKIFVNVDLLTV